MRLRNEGFGEYAALAELSQHVARSNFRDGRAVKPKEIADAVTSAFRGVASKPSIPATGNATRYHPDTGWPSEMSKPADLVDWERLSPILAGSFELVDLWECSPSRPPDYATPSWALDQLFDASDLLCIGKSSADFSTKRRCDWSESELKAAQFIVPNPSRKPMGKTKDGNNSAHCRDATGPRRYIIAESDAGLDIDQQARVVEHLRTFTKARLAAVVLSGGKSVHAWFRCDEVPADKLFRWFRYAVTIGADARLWLPEQLVRLPDGRRDTGITQSLIYLNPSA